MPVTVPPDLYIDLARLPAPQVIEEIDYEALLAAYKARVLEELPSLEAALNLEQSPTNVILQVEAYAEMIVRARVNAAARAVMLPFSQGSDLDNLGALFGVARLAGETDARYRLRLQLAPEAYTTAGSAGAYRFHALTAAPDLQDAVALSPKPGYVRVVLMSAGASKQPSAAQIEAVRARLADPAVKPLTDIVSVVAAKPIPAEIAAHVYLYPGPDAGLVRAEIDAALAALKARLNWIGRDLTLSQVYGALNREGVQGVDLFRPSADVPVKADQYVDITTDVKISVSRRE